MLSFNVPYEFTHLLGVAGVVDKADGSSTGCSRGHASRERMANLRCLQLLKEEKERDTEAWTIGVEVGVVAAKVQFTVAKNVGKSMTAKSPEVSNQVLTSLPFKAVAVTPYPSTKGKVLE
ncbi:hypothetical protein V6N11_068373 [Hibiscus sabdariffa]|uniref:Uncharacterized protein n=1 Tax=Hibiscus sabdariffa TaxID=183260 RepID=A0ABR2A237_9ROSI